MDGPAEPRELAGWFLEVIPIVLHRIGNELRAIGGKDEPVTLAQFRAMGALRCRTHSLGELAAAYHVSPATMSRLISTLVGRSWVLRESDPSDRRQVVLRLTPEGEAIWKMLAERGVEHLAAILGELTPDELDALKRALGGLSRVVEARACRARCD